MSDEKYEDNYVHDMLNVWDDGFEGSLRERARKILVDTLQKIPKPVVNKVLEDVIFVIMSGAYGTSSFQRASERRKKDPPLNLTRDRELVEIDVHVILLNFALMERDEFDEEKMRSTVAHEIAHFNLKHHKISVHPQADKEKEADDLIEKWGFKRVYQCFERFSHS